MWGTDWRQAKTVAECYDYLFEVYCKMCALGMDPAALPASSEYAAEHAASIRENAESIVIAEKRA